MGAMLLRQEAGGTRDCGPPGGMQPHAQRVPCFAFTYALKHLHSFFQAISGPPKDRARLVDTLTSPYSRQVA
jgi:hypothetical protein